MYIICKKSSFSETTENTSVSYHTYCIAKSVYTANSLTFDRFVPSEFVDCIVGLTHCSWWQFTSKRTPLMEKSC